MAEQQKRLLCGGNRIFYAVPHPHAHGFNIAQHGLCGEKPVHHTEKGVEKQCEHQTEPNPQPDMWHIKNSYTPKRKRV